MTRVQLVKHLNILQKDLTNIQKRMSKISKALGIEENHLLDKVLEEIEESIKLGEGK